MDYNTNNVALGVQIASKLSSSTFNLFQVENTANINAKLDKEVYNITNQSVLDLINVRAGEFTPIPPLYFELNITGQTPIMNLVFTKIEITTLSNFNNKDEITALLTTVDNSVSANVSAATLNSSLSN